MSSGWELNISWKLTLTLACHDLLHSQFYCATLLCIQSVLFTPPPQAGVCHEAGVYHDLHVLHGHLQSGERSGSGNLHCLDRTTCTADADCAPASSWTGVPPASCAA